MTYCVYRGCHAYFEEFGKGKPHRLLFFQGSASHWSWYLPSIQLLAQDFHVIVPIIAGHEPERQTDFVSIQQTVEEVTQGLLALGYDSLYAAYGLSFGGSMVLRMLAEQRIPIHKAILDAAITPYELPRFITRLILLRDYWGFRLIRRLPCLLQWLFPPERWIAPGCNQKDEYQKLIDFMQTMSKKTIRNVFDSANNYAMPTPLPPIDTRIAYWYGALEKRSRARDLDWVFRRFPGVQAREIQDKNHAELVLMHSRQFYRTALDFLQE